MAGVGVQLNVELLGLKEVQDALTKLNGKEQKAQILKAALTKAIEPAFQKLKEITPVGPTGNLRRAIAKKIVVYQKDGNAVGLVGYKRAGKGQSESAAGGKVRSGPDRAFHQYWLERGTKGRDISKPADRPYVRKAHTRKMKSGVVAEVQSHNVARQGGYIASSFNSLGGFEGFVPTPRMPRGQKGQRVETKPGYPNAYFKKSSTPITINPAPAGGRSGQPPLATTFEATKAQMGEILASELRISLEQALSTVIQSASRGVG
jgi:hypothetical protein